MNQPISLAEPLMIGPVRIPNRVLMAPMSGVSDQPFRRRGVMHGAGMAVSEMIASGELGHNRPETVRRSRKDARTGIHAVQLAGRNPHWMAEAARIAEDAGADIIDINMGCPAKKVIGGYAGSALMREPERAMEIIESVVGATSRPVTLKMRLGWDEMSINAPDIARQAENAGVQLITVHGRTRCQLYRGRADWDAIAAVRNAISIPLVANGDVENADDARTIVQQSGADAIMIGRGHYGQPWLAGTIARSFGYSDGFDAPSTPDEMSEYVIAHYEEMLELYGRERGCRHARKHLGWYLDRHATSLEAETRTRLLRSFDTDCVKSLLEGVDWLPGSIVQRKIAA